MSTSDMRIRHALASMTPAERNMGKGREIRSFDYVNHPYERVRDALSEDAAAVFQAATKAASERAQTVASALRVNIAGLEVSSDIAISIHSVEEKKGGAKAPLTTRIELEWEAAKAPRLFPLMKAELSIYALTATETQLDFAGNYTPPLGPLGTAANALVGYRIAEACVHRFLTDVARYLREGLSREAKR